MTRGAGPGRPMNPGPRAGEGREGALMSRPEGGNPRPSRGGGGQSLLL